MDATGSMALSGSMSPQQVEQVCAEFRRDYDAVTREIGRVIVGQREVVREVLVTALADGHALLEGVPGLAKTLLIRTLAQAVDLSFNRIQFTPDLMPSDITGTNIIEEDDHGRKSYKFIAGPVFANIILADEINRATPKTQCAMLECMQERIGHGLWRAAAAEPRRSSCWPRKTRWSRKAPTRCPRRSSTASCSRSSSASPARTT